MSISEISTQLTAIQQVASQFAVPPAPVGSSPASFADLLDAASAGDQPTSTAASAGTATDTTASGTTAASAAGTTSLSEATLISSMLEQSQAQALMGTLDDSGDDSSGGDGLDSMLSLLPELEQSGATGSTGATLADDELTSADDVSDGLATDGVSAATGTSGLSLAGGSSGATTSGDQVLAAAESQIGVQEQPMGSNDGPEIETYRSAVAGSQAGEPWCAYFASWAAKQAGEPLGPNGEGFGSVADLTSWASSAGRLLPASTTPAPGDLILFGDHHVGIVESVNPDGSLTTVEGNYNNQVSLVHREPSEATGYVQM